jgi:hypothetical protein
LGKEQARKEILKEVILIAFNNIKSDANYINFINKLKSLEEKEK